MKLFIQLATVAFITCLAFACGRAARAADADEHTGETGRAGWYAGIAFAYEGEQLVGAQALGASPSGQECASALAAALAADQPRQKPGRVLVGLCVKVPPPPDAPKADVPTSKSIPRKAGQGNPTESL